MGVWWIFYDTEEVPSERVSERGREREGGRDSDLHLREAVDVAKRWLRD